ncbi:hypothetical protein E4U19_006839 [Claviceps sp. Clav32 group G5]|nr:hypothetical protein E4U19_006839 [Claviceps sp. Clav32 group G5]KAG6049906.1 hypothetical protein E4U39_005249 [Claviceps sp. Clav50 group G5]
MTTTSKNEQTAFLRNSKRLDELEIQSKLSQSIKKFGTESNQKVPLNHLGQDQLLLSTQRQEITKDWEPFRSRPSHRT